MTESTKLWLAFGRLPLLAVMVIGNWPKTVGVPLSSPPLVKVTPAGRAPTSVNVGAGFPVAVTWKVPAVFCLKTVLAMGVMAGALPAVKVKLRPGLGPAGAALGVMPEPENAVVASAAVIRKRTVPPAWRADRMAAC